MVGIPAIPTCSIDKEATQFAKSTAFRGSPCLDRKSTRLNSSHLGNSYAVFCLKKKNVDHALRHAWSDGYVSVNRDFADAVLEELQREPEASVCCHDYHRSFAPRLPRESAP